METIRVGAYRVADEIEETPETYDVVLVPVDESLSVGIRPYGCYGDGKITISFPAYPGDWGKQKGKIVLLQAVSV